MLAAACAAASVSGACFAWNAVALREERRRRRSARDALNSQDDREILFECGGVSAWVLGLAVRESRRVRVPGVQPLLEVPLLGWGMRDASRMIARAGLTDVATEEGLRVVRAKASLGFALAGALAGFVFSVELSLLLAGIGLFAGFACVPRALKGEAAARNADMERHLAEMVDVVVLGLRSGLSFERSFSLYPRYFETGLAHAMQRAAGRWDMGLLTREEALRRLEGEYESPLLSRVVSSMVRSLRFGTSIADALEASASEAREAHRARMEEKVAKVAVKMMLPVGGLILPAMLLLVLGPVLLELVEGF